MAQREWVSITPVSDGVRAASTTTANRTVPKTASSGHVDLVDDCR
ncbi:hypothetical protein [Streptomyces jumonjinensis]|nr:hypothetical protein [Streptomyces jumonjinensis]